MKNKVLIKIGGRAFADKTAFEELASDIKAADVPVIIVHGGGAEISQALQNANRQTVFVDGIRVTQKEDVEIVEKVLSDTVNSRIAGYMAEFGIPVQRMSGKTEKLLVAQRTTRNGKDIGLVGEIVKVNAESIGRAWEHGLTPIVSPISADENGATYNVNADTAAAALAVGAECTDLVYFSDVPGILDEKNKPLPTLTLDAGMFLIKSGIISGGMVAKLESIFTAIENGVDRVHITQWQGRNTLVSLVEGGRLQKTTIHN